MPFTLLLLLLSAALFSGMLLLLEVGRRLGRRDLARNPEGLQKGLGAVEGAVFGLLGLLVAFTFSGAVSRLDARRELITKEANAIGTAYLRLDLLPAPTQPVLREAFRQYVEARIQAYQCPQGSGESTEAFRRATQLQGQIWGQVILACQGSATPPTMLLLPALNDMIDITCTRAMALKMHPPMIVYLMLGVLALSSALLAGYGMAEGLSRNWAHTFGFALIFAITVYVILDVEYPRRGLIRVDEADALLVELRASMK